PPVQPSLDLAGLGNRLFYLGADDEHGSALWVNDPPGGSRLVENLAGEAPAANPQELVDLGGRLLFSSYLGLFATAGHAETTFPLGPGGRNLTLVGGRAFYFVDPFEPQLWTTDGTPEGTRQLTSDEVLGLPILTAFRGRLIFLRRFSDHSELWQ